MLLIAAFAIGQGDDDDHARLLARSQRIRTENFATSHACALCHSNAPRVGSLRDAEGRAIAPYDLWRGTMMANAARDPFFRAAMAAEAAAMPGKGSEVEAKCLRCHSPMAHEELKRKGTAIDAGLFKIESRYRTIAEDGASCTVCHMIEAKNLGKPESWNGNWEINEDREIYGPHDDVFGNPMRAVLRYWPTEGQHIMKSEMCATCHTLFVKTASGHTLPEQMPYLEWKNSDFADKQSCQDCHMPRTSETGAAIRTRIAREPGRVDFEMIEPREPYGRHLLVGGNTLIPAILRDNAEELRVTAPKAAFDEVIAATKAQLTQRTARIEIGDIVKRAEFTVRVHNLTGHKFPTAHPSRRAWLHVKLKDGRGKVFHESGAYDDRGRIVGADGKPLPSELAGGPILPHYTQVEGVGQVPIFQAVLRAPKGGPTFLALQSAGYMKDNRLLPRGWKKDGPHAESTMPVGIDEEDEDFAAGGDSVIYMVTVPETVRGAYTIEVALCYQTLSPRFAAELFTTDHPEVAKFQRMYEKADARPVVVATAFMRVPR